MTYAIACGDVMPGCEAHFSADSMDELVEQVVAHAGADHGVTEVTPEVGAAVERAIRQT
jgi:predicted small metal-binding protein